MRAVVQRVRRGAVEVDGRVVSSIGRGVVVLLGVGEGDTEEDVTYMVDKVANLRIFPDDEGRMNRSLVDVGGEALVVSQFTLYGDVRRGRRPSFTGAAPPDRARDLYQEFCNRLGDAGVRVATGEFRAMMLVKIDNDGPVTILIDSEKNF